ncbi:hypothetical protein TWF191_007075 [Orbilia oligospora]|uniref:C2H2-type domain-containing protein n=1 Tax=Orbilia oligospora TaxID=2813651 RepID=A0A7C8UUH4_ORBOL|nr:hypothetical protein TWF191_007075 [Orbilia oligospora]
MASNYCNYNYGNSSYPQNQQQSFSDQYPSTAPAAGTAPQTSQKYYSASQSQPRQTASAVRQSVAADSRSNTTQYNGLHFPAPAPARQTVAPTSHDIGHLAGSAVNTVGNSGGGSRSNASAMGGASGYGSAGHYQPASKQSASQPRQRADAVTGRAHDRAEHALSASTGWNTGTGTTSSVGQAAPAAANVHYGYSYSKPSSATSQQQQSQQNNYYAAKRASATSSNNAQKISSNNSASRSSSATSNQPSQGHLNQGFGQPAQTGSKSSYSYEPPSVKTNPSDTAPEYQQTAEYGKTYSDDADQNQSYLHRVYTLPQPTPTRNATDNSNSYFPNTHATETSYNPSSQTLNSSTMVQTASYSKPAQDLGRASSATTSASSYNYGNIASTPGQPNQQQYYQHHGSANAPQHSAASYNNVAASIVSTTPTAPIPTPEPVSVPQPPITPTPAAKKPRKSRQSLSQKSPAKKVPKYRTPKKSNGTAASSTITEVTGSQRPESLPAQHPFYPSDPKAGKSSTKTGASQRAAMNVDLPPEQSLSPDPLGGPEVHTMEQHMREMVEKMREYQSKDPTAFQQVWENVKRGNPPAAGGKGAASISSMGLKGTPGIDSPRQVVANLAKPPAAKQPAPVAIGKQNPPLGNAASQAQRTVWPSSQKIALSQTVSTFLSSSNQSCSESYVMSLLDYGPTFAELCQKLENHGYRFERNDLAQELLKTTESVDPSKAASTASPAISAAPPSSDVPSRAMTPQSMKSFNPRNIKDSITNLIPQDHHHDHSQNFVAPSLIYREVSYPTHFGQPESNVRSDEPAAPPTPFPMPIPDTHTIVEKPAQEPGKKRVSLAKKPQKSSSSKVLRTPHPQAPQALQTAHPGSESQAPVAPQPSFSPAPREEPMPDASPLTITITQPISRYENLIQAATPRNSLVQPQGHDDNSALEKLQSKLEAQMSRLKRLEEPVELLPPPTSVPAQSTPQPPPPPPPPSRKPAWPRAPIWDRKDALRRNTYDPRTIVHDVLQATGRHPQYEGLNSGLAILKRLHPDVFDSMTDLAAIPWDIYDPPPAPLPGEERKPKKSIVLGEEETRGRKREPVPFKGIPRTEPIPSIPALMPEGKVRGKRGRPRGSRGTPRSARGGRGGATAGGPLETSNTATNSAGDPSTAANAHQYGTVTRVNINTLRNGGSASSSRGDSGRKRKYGDSPDPHYPGDGGGGTWGGSSFQTLPAFKCQWEKCNQELQNLETLRKHLVKKHKAENIQAWDSHVLGEHLKVVRDELGDGMSVSAARSLSRDSSAHSVEGRLRSMSLDRAGRSLTPVITQAPHGYKFTPPPGFSGGTQFKLAHEFPEEIDIKTDADERKFFEDELARIGRMGAGTESFNIPDLPGLEFDSTEGWAIKTRKLTTDFSKVAPLPPQGWNESGGGSGEKGKG